VLEIDQEISNSVPNSSGASGNPDIFERSIKTEVLARSGQTVMLGGLVSQNYDTGGSSAPGLGKIPLLGQSVQREIEK
jgi:general secretion pathway protein D